MGKLAKNLLESFSRKPHGQSVTGLTLFIFLQLIEDAITILHFTSACVPYTGYICVYLRSSVDVVFNNLRLFACICG